MNITHANIKTIRKDLDSALAEVGKKYGLSVSTGRITFDATSFRTKLSAAVVDKSFIAAGVKPADAAMVTAFNANKARWGVTANIGDTIHSGGRKFTLVGAKPSYRKYPLIVESARGARYKLPLSAAL